MGRSYTVSANGGGSGNPVVFSSGSPTVCSVVGSTVSFDSVGTCVVLADQAAGAGYLAAPQASQTIQVRKLRQTIAFTSLAPTGALVGDTYAVSATGGGSGNPVVFAIAPAADGVCSIQGSQVSFDAIGECVVVANQAGDADYGSATASQSIPVAAPVVDPTIVAKVVTESGRHHGWYRTPVHVVFTCTAGSAALATPCPSPVVLDSDGADQSATGTVTAVDGGSAGTTVYGIDIDQKAPKVKVRGAQPHRTYHHERRLRCGLRDWLSGPQHCSVATRTTEVPGHHGRWSTVTYRVVGTDRAGNERVVLGWYRIKTR